VRITLKDSNWASVDADDTAASQREFSGTVDAGRFIPDHFRVTEGSLAPACAAGGFSYLGATLAWATPAVTLTAESAANTTTLNYEGALEKLPSTLGAPTYAALAGTLNTAGLADPAIGVPAAGVANVTLPALSFVRALAGAFDAEIRIDLPAFTDEDGVVPAESPIVLGALTAGGGVAFTGNAKSQRFGRLYFVPAYGSERLPMAVTLRAEYFDGVAFLHNAADACTTLATADVTLSGIGGQAHTVSASGNGLWTVTLSAPNATGQASLSVDLASPPVTPAVAWPLLQADANGDGTYAEDPAGTATFGLYAQDERRIYQREVVGN
jgi:MSHA biogenesis protein MshQ